MTGANAAASRESLRGLDVRDVREAEKHSRMGEAGCGALLYERLVRRLPTRFPQFYLERGITDHLRRDTEKSRACAIAPDLLEQIFWEMKDTSPKPGRTWDGGKII